jgi:transposase
MSPVTPPASTVGELWDLRHVTYDRTVAWIAIARTRQVIVKKTICGVDVSKARLDACIKPGGAFASFDNDTAGIAKLAAFCRQHEAELVVMEASGGYERRAFLELWQAGLSCALVNPRSVRRYAEAMGYLEKTDRIDAAVIAEFAITKNLAPTPLPSPAQQRLKALVTRLRQVTADLTVQKQRRAGLLDNPEMLASIDEVIALLKRQSRSLEGEIASMIDDDPLWALLAQSWRSVKGVAGRTVARLHAELPEIGTYNNKAIAKLVGIAPLADDSGKHKGKRRIRGGRAGVRSILFLVAATAARYDKSLADFRARLVAAGKEKMVIRIALARKLLVRLNAKAREARAAYANAT